MMKMKRVMLLAVAILLAGCAAAQAQYITGFEEFPANTNDEGNHMFTWPSASALTRTYIAGEDGAEVASAVEQPGGGYPATYGPDDYAATGDNCLRVKWNWTDSRAKMWDCLNTYDNAYGDLPTYLQSPTISFNLPFQFKARLECDASTPIPDGTLINIAIGVCETNTTAAIGEPGGHGTYPHTTGPKQLEWIGVTSWHANLQNEFVTTHQLAVGSGWQTLTFDPLMEPIWGVNNSYNSGTGVWTYRYGNNVLNSTTGKGSLDHIVLAQTYPSNGYSGIYTLYLDDFEVLPEPGSLVALATGVLGLAGILRRKSR